MGLTEAPHEFSPRKTASSRALQVMPSARSVGQAWLVIGSVLSATSLRASVQSLGSEDMHYKVIRERARHWKVSPVARHSVSSHESLQQGRKGGSQESHNDEPRMNTGLVRPRQYMSSLALWLTAGSVLCLSSYSPGADDTSTGFTGSPACGECHASLYQSYLTTPMARSSGRMEDSLFRENLAKGAFLHSLSGVSYRVLREESGAYFEFSKPTPVGDLPPINGRRRLDYFIGSGVAGRSYISTVEGFLFQTPVSYYSAQAKWDISPGYERSETMNLVRPIEVECLQCHASRLQAIPGTQNRFREPAFLENGISCERCHGPGKTHVDRMRAGKPEGPASIVNPAKLDARRRDSVCAQCHLTGEAQVMKAGKSHSDFLPGEDLSDHSVSFVWKSAPGQGLKVASHYEKLWQSLCKKASGDRLWCGSCHDPHSLPQETARLDYFRQKCLACHQSANCKADPRLRSASSNDCVACHMPKSETIDVGHVVYTDHSIPRKLPEKNQINRNTLELVLVPFGGVPPSARDLGLAYSKLAARDQVYFTRALELLKQAAEEEAEDPELLLQLGYFYDRAGNEGKAMPLYERAIQLDRTKLEAAINLGAILTARGRHSDAVRLWEDVLVRNTGLDTARINLALAHLRSGNRDAAERSLLKALEYQPDFPLARKLWSELQRRTSP